MNNTTSPGRKPYVGETILFTANPDDTVAHSNHNKDEIPAIVTRVWSEMCINCKIIPDCGPMQDRTSVVHQSANPAGYHFRFIGEEKISPVAPNETGEDSKNASSFLKNKAE